MLKNYELLYILHPDLEGSSDKISEKVAAFVKKADGEITNQEDWGKRKLAYKIAKNDFGVYVLVNFTLPSEKLPEIERDLRLSEEIIRFLVVALPEENSAKEEKAKAKTTKKAEKPAEKKVDAAQEEPVKEEKADEKPVKKAEKKSDKPAEKKVEKNTKKEEAATEKERMKKLDEKLEEILGD